MSQCPGYAPSEQWLEEGAQANPSSSLMGNNMPSLRTAILAPALSIVVAQWVGTVSGVIGALMLALHVPCSDFGFLFHLLSSSSWIFAGLRARNAAIWTLNASFLAINLLAISRWLRVI